MTTEVDSKSIILTALKVGVTGHRKLEHMNHVVERRFTTILDKLFTKHSIEEVHTGMAIGFDQLIARVCVLLDIPFVAVVPFEGQEAVWPDRCKAEYYDLLSKAKEIDVVSEGGFANWKFIARNKRIVDRTNVLIGYLPHEKDGGTKQCMAYGCKVGVRTINIGSVLPQDSAGEITSWF